MTTYLISDIHLNPAQPHLTELFFKFLDCYAVKADAVYILGDLFEVWIGDDALTEFNQTLLTAFQRIHRLHIPIYFMRGNRDFLIGKSFAKQAGFNLLPEASIIDLYGEKVLLMHGDNLCIRDRRHQHVRKILRNPFLQNIFLKLPLRWRYAIADKIRNSSMKRGKQLSAIEMDVPTEIIPALFQNYGTNVLIHGHTHRPSIEYFYLEDQIKSRIVLSDWGRTGNMLVCQSDGTKQLMDFRLKDMRGKLVGANVDNIRDRNDRI